MVALTYVPAGRSGYLQKPSQSQRFQPAPQSKDPNWVIGSQSRSSGAFPPSSRRSTRMPLRTSVTFTLMFACQTVPVKRRAVRNCRTFQQYQIPDRPLTMCRGRADGADRRVGNCAANGARFRNQRCISSTIFDSGSESRASARGLCYFEGVASRRQL